MAVRIPPALTEADLGSLAPPERALLAGLGAARQPSWAAGRAALRAALEDAGFAPRALLYTPRGGPRVPPGATGSISHKRDLAAGLAAPSHDGFSVGIDLEADAPLRVDVAGRVLTGEEAAALAGLPEDARRRETVLRFCAKEALYKALHPLLTRTLSFREAAIASFAADGGAEIELRLAHGEGPFEAELRWMVVEGFFLTTARVRLGR